MRQRCFQPLLLCAGSLVTIKLSRSVFLRSHILSPRTRLPQVVQQLCKMVGFFDVFLTALQRDDHRCSYSSWAKERASRSRKSQHPASLILSLILYQPPGQEGTDESPPVTWFLTAPNPKAHRAISLGSWTSLPFNQFLNIFYQKVS